MKSGSGSAVAFGRVLQAVRKYSSKNQTDIAGSFSPQLSVAAVSMAESGNRPPKTEAIVRGYAAALELDEDSLVELWWGMQGMVEVEDRAQERHVQQWWRQLKADDDDEEVYYSAVKKAKAVRNPNEDWRAPSEQLVALAAAICQILRHLLGDSWTIRYRLELGLHERVDGYFAVANIEVSTRNSEESGPNESPELTATFTCPEPVARPIPPDPKTRSKTEGIPPDVAWILSSVEAMPARERAAVAGFIHGLREGASLFSEAPTPHS